MMEQINWETLSAEEKKLQLYLKQKKMLDDFLARGAITQAQYETSLGGLTEKMGMTEFAGHVKE